MYVLGLTGSIAAGKSRVARCFEGFATPVFDSDAAVHRLLRGPSPLVDSVVAAFPGVDDGAGGVDRKALGQRVFADEAALRRLEGLIHPAVQTAQRRFLEACCRERQPLVVLDIPLLFETGAERRLDAVMVVDVHPRLHRQRALARPGMTEARLDAILNKQMPAAEKRRRGDVVLRSGYDRGHVAAEVAGVIRATRHRPGRAWPDRWRRR